MAKQGSIIITLEESLPSDAWEVIENTIAQSLYEEGFRGKIEVDIEKCIGCGGCANVCPARLIVITDTETTRIMEYILNRCTYCGRCAEVCPEDAITMSLEYQLATNDNKDLYIRNELYMGTCGRCGRCFKPDTVLDKMMVTGFREKAEGKL